MKVLNKHTIFNSVKSSKPNLQLSNALSLNSQIYDGETDFFLRDYLFSSNDMCYHILFCSRFL